MSSKKSRTNVCVVDENLNEVKASTSNKQSSLTSQKSRKRAVEYVEDKNKMINYRYKKCKEIIDDIKNLKLCTEDNTYLEFYKEETNELARFCTLSNIMMQHKQMSLTKLIQSFNQFITYCITKFS